MKLLFTLFVFASSAALAPGLFAPSPAAAGTAAGPAAKDDKDMLPGPVYSLPTYVEASGPFVTVANFRLLDGELKVVTDAPVDEGDGPVIVTTPAPPSQTPLETIGRNVSDMAVRARASASDARSAAAEVRARLNAEDALAASEAVRYADGEVAEAAPSLLGAIAEANKAQEGTELAAKAAGQAVQTAEMFIKEQPQRAAEAASKGVQDELAELLKEFQDWRMSALHNMEREGIAAGSREAKPWNRALQIVEKRVAEYEQRASALSNQAQALRSSSTALANGAVSKQAGGDLAGAAKDMMDAHQMFSQAAMFENQGLKLMMDAHVLGVNIPAYITGAQNAAHAATYRYAKNAFAPPPVAGPGGIPPPLNVLERGSFLRRERTSPFKMSIADKMPQRHLDPFAAQRSVVTTK